MFHWLGEYLLTHYGDGIYRLFTSRLVLASLGFLFTAATTWFLLPRLARRLPTDRGREHAVGSAASVGKPTAAGVIFVPIFLLAVLLFVPFSGPTLWVLLPVLAAMLFGFLDDRSTRAWGEYRKAILDVGVAAAAVVAVHGASLEGLGAVEMWLPLFKANGGTTFPAWVYLPIATAVLWISVNATNCSDGVDGLSGSLLVLGFIYLGAILYLVLGHQEVSQYLRLPHVAMGAEWGVMAFILVGTLSGYLWHNANPSSMMMGDAGSRPLGLLLGIFVLAAGNPFLLVVVGGVVLVNGGTGLVKVALLRFFKIGVLGSVRFPLHDHCRKNWGWSNTQVLMRFMILQGVFAPIAIILMIKLR